MSNRSVVAFHGEVVPGCSPGLHGPVVVDEEGHLIRESGEPDEEVTIAPEGPLPGVGTRVGPWPHTPGKVVISVDVALLRKARKCLYDGAGDAGVLRSFLDAIERRDDDALRSLGAQRIAGASTVVAWYAARADVDALRLLLRGIAVADLRAALARGGDLFVREQAWQLQRAATGPEDDLMALAALQLAGLDASEVNELLPELVQDLSPPQRKRGFAAALAAVRAMKKAARQGAAGAARGQARVSFRIDPSDSDKVAV